MWAISTLLLRNRTNTEMKPVPTFRSRNHFRKWRLGPSKILNANLNQEYVNWLQIQSLPNSKGPMGITEAEAILSNRPDLDHAYQKRFLTEKMQHMEGSFGEHGLPSSNQAVAQIFQKAQQNITPSPEKFTSKIQEHAIAKRTDTTFTLDSEITKKAQKQLATADQQILQQQESVLRQGKTRRDIISDQTK